MPHRAKRRKKRLMLSRGDHVCVAACHKNEIEVHLVIHAQGLASACVMLMWGVQPSDRKSASLLCLDWKLHAKVNQDKVHV